MNETPLNAALPRAHRHLDILLVTADETQADEWAGWIGQLLPDAPLHVARGLEQAHTLVPALARPPQMLLIHAGASTEAAYEFLSDLHTAHRSLAALMLLEDADHGRLDAIDGNEWVDRLTLPCDRVRFAAALHELRHRLSPAGQGRFEGTFRNLRVLDILQLKCSHRESSLLEFAMHSGNSGRVWIELGQIRHAEAGGLTGIPALALLLNSRGGTVTEAAYVPPTGWGSIDADWQTALLTAVHEVDRAYGAGKAQDVAAGADSPLAAPERLVPGDDPDRLFQMMEDHRRILLADDSPLMLQFMQEVIWREFPGLAIISLETGGEVHAAVRQYRPDLVVLDYFLPDANGDEVCRELLADADCRETPVLLISGQLTDPGALRGELANIKGFLRKPFFPPQFVQALRAVAPQLEGAVVA